MKETGVTVAQKLDTQIGALVKSSDLLGFQKADMLTASIVFLQTELTDAYMKNIMSMQNLKLGFKTDKEGGYPVGIVRNCLIEAVLIGVQPTGNMFNIIAGNCYITKEGYGHLLSKITGLEYDIIPDLPRISQDKNSAAVKVKISWSLNNGVKGEKEMEFPIKTNQYMGADGVIGKATRKARKWLFEKITGVETSDGDTEDVGYKVMGKDGGEIQEVKAEQVKEGVKNLFDTK